MLEKMRRADLENTRKAIEKKVMLDTMEVESMRWPTLSNLNNSIDVNVILP